MQLAKSFSLLQYYCLPYYNSDCCSDVGFRQKNIMNNFSCRQRQRLMNLLFLIISPLQDDGTQSLELKKRSISTPTIIITEETLIVVAHKRVAGMVKKEGGFFKALLMMMGLYHTFRLNYCKPLATVLFIQEYILNDQLHKRDRTAEYKAVIDKYTKFTSEQLATAKTY